MAEYLGCNRRRVSDWLTGRQCSRALYTVTRRALEAGPHAAAMDHLRLALGALQTRTRQVGGGEVNGPALGGVGQPRYGGEPASPSPALVMAVALRMGRSEEEAAKILEALRGAITSHGGSVQW